MAITLHGLECFLTVARTLHFSQAARAMRISPSSLSEQIGKLESALGRKLFDRAARGVTLTPAGEQLVKMAAAVIDDVAAITDWARGGGEKTIIVGVAASSTRMRSILALAAERLPGTRFQLRAVGFSGGVPALRRREVDCVISFELSSNARPSGLHAVELWTEELVVVLPADHRLASAASVDVADLWGEVLITVTPGEPGEPGRAEEWYGRIDPSLLEKCRIAPLMNGPDETVELVAAGAGINIAGASVIGSYSRPGIAFVPLNTEHRASASLLLLDEPASPELKRFVELARTATARR